MEKLVLDFLDFSRFETKTYELSLSKFDVVRLLEKIAQNFSVQAEQRNIRIVPE